MNCQSTLNLDLRIFAGIFTARRVIVATQEKKKRLRFQEIRKYQNKIKIPFKDKAFVVAVKNYAEAFLKVFCSCPILLDSFTLLRISRVGVFLGKGVLKIRSKFTEDHPGRSAISMKLFCNFVEIAVRPGCPPVSLLHISRTPFLKNTSGWLLLFVSKNTLFIVVNSNPF